MKKFFIFALALCAAVAFAQESEVPADSAGAESAAQKPAEEKSEGGYISEEHLTGENPWDEVYFTKEKGVSEIDDTEYLLSINFYPYTHEAIFSYNCPQDNFFETDVVHILTKRLKKFVAEKGFVSYWYTKPKSCIPMSDGTVSCLFHVAFEVYKPQPR